VTNAPTNTVAPMPMPTVDPVITSFASAAATSQPQLTNVAANPLATPLAGSLLVNQFPSLVNPLLAQPDLGNASFAGANAGGVGVRYPGPGGSNACDQNVELASALSRLMLGQAQQSVAFPQQNLLASVLAANQPGLTSLLAAGGVGNLGLAGQYPGILQQNLLQQNLLHTTALQSLLSTGSGTSLLSPADQQQLLINAGLLSVPGHTATHPTSGIHSTTTPGSAAVNRDPSGASAAAGGLFQTAAGRAQVGSTAVPTSLPANAFPYPPPR